MIETGSTFNYLNMGDIQHLKRTKLSGAPFSNKLQSAEAGMTSKGAS